MAVPQPLPPQRDEAAALKVKELELQLKMMADEAERRSAHERMMKVCPAVTNRPW